MRTINKYGIRSLLCFTENKRARRALACDLISYTELELKELLRELATIKENTALKNKLCSSSYGLTDIWQLESKLNYMIDITEKYQANRKRDEGNKRQTAENILLDLINALDETELSSE